MNSILKPVAAALTADLTKEVAKAVVISTASTGGSIAAIFATGKVIDVVERRKARARDLEALHKFVNENQ